MHVWVNAQKMGDWMSSAEGPCSTLYGVAYSHPTVGMCLRITRYTGSKDPWPFDLAYYTIRRLD